MPQTDRVRRLTGLAGAAALLTVLAACSQTSPGTATLSPDAAATTSATRSTPAVGPPSPTSGPAPTAPTGSASAPTAPTGAASAVPIPTAGAGPSPTAPSGGFGPAGTVTKLTGTIEAGVEAGCFVLVGANGAVQANLMGLDPATAPLGSTVVVTGKFQPDMMTTCMQGRPFVVAAVTPE